MTPSVSENGKTLYRWLILAASVMAMLFAGIIYAWSILKVPFEQDFGVLPEQLSLNFTLTMCFFCVGGLVGSFLSRKIGVKLANFISAVLAGSGMALTGLLDSENINMLYLTYAVITGLGIGIAYNVIISTVSAWFPDKKGLCTGCLMMGFGTSSLILGNLASLAFDSSLAFRGTYILLGIALFVVLAIVSLILRLPNADVVFLQVNKKVNNQPKEFEQKDYTTKEMLKRFSFWRAFVFLVFITAVGNAVISFARDLALSVGANVSLATTLVGVLAVCNGLGRILTGALFDNLGRKKTMFIATVLAIVASGITLISVVIGSLALCIVGLCLTGLSYGSCPTMNGAIVSAFYGQKHFATNFSIITCNLIFASFIATACSYLLDAFGGYTAPFILLLALAVASFVLNLTIRRP